MKSAGTTPYALPLIVAVAAVGSPAHAQTVPITVLSGAIEQYTDYTSGQPGSNLYESEQLGASITASSFNWSGSCTSCSGYGATGSGTASITDGNLGAAASLSVTGTTPGGNFVLSATSEATYGDLLTITGGTGSGVLALRYSLDGSITQTGSGNSVSLVLGGLSSAPTGTLASENGGALTGTILGPFIGVGGHGDTLTEYVPFTYGTTFAITPDLLADPEYFSSQGNTAPFTASVDFYNTLSLNSALVYGGTPRSLGALNSSADISSEDGLGYGPGGLTPPAPVPLPPAAWLLLSGLGGIALLSRGSAARSA